jgi:hypothetical protein
MKQIRNQTKKDQTKINIITIEKNKTYEKLQLNDKIEKKNKTSIKEIRTK